MKEALQLNGIIPLYKPKGITSHDCVVKVRQLLQIKKVGHTGTLDPLVEGVLPICVGEATKIIPFLADFKKTYIADISLGKATTTEDLEGEVVLSERVIQPPTDEEIDEVLQSFVGNIIQVPPMYSAVKVKGKRLYEYAREGKSVERPQRKVTIRQIERIETSVNPSNTSFRIKVTCSKGTYIRTLCVDIGKALGYPAHMAYLQRIESDTFHLHDAVTFRDIEENIKENNVEQILFPIDRGLSHLDTFQVNRKTKQKVLHGQKLPVPQIPIKTDPFKVMFQDELLAIYTLHKHNNYEIKPIRVFNIHKSVGE